MTRMIVADSAADLLTLPDTLFAAAPLKIITAHGEYTDDAHLDVPAMVHALQKEKAPTGTSCPNEADYLQAFGQADEVFCITLTGTLSGSYQAAQMAKQTYEAQYPGRRVMVLNSLSAGPEMTLLVEEAQRLLAQGLPFDAVEEALRHYSGHTTGLVFMLASMHNLARNGRVSPLMAKMAGLMGIRVVGCASEKGDLQPLSKARGEARALQTIVQYLKAQGVQKGRVRIAHCLNAPAAETLRTLLQQELHQAQVRIHECRGLCSYYAELGGLLVGFERV